MASPFDKIVDMIKMLDLNDDAIDMNRKIKCIQQDFTQIVGDEDMLRESFEYINDNVLLDREASLKFALVSASRDFDAISVRESRVRYLMVNILQNNFQNAAQLKKKNKDIFYNSLTMLGEYYNRTRLAHGEPFKILGKSLLELLIKEMSVDNETYPTAEVIDTKLAKLILSQITLNGKLLGLHHKKDLDVLLYEIRRHLIESNIARKTKAFLLMTLDLYYNNFAKLDENIERMYTEYLLDTSDISDQNLIETDLNSLTTQSSEHGIKMSATESSAQILQSPVQTLQTNQEESINEGESEDLNKSFDLGPMEIRWSEEVPDIVDNESVENNLNISENDKDEHISSVDENGENYQRRRNTRSNSGCDDDRYSVRSEGGSIRLYNVSERLKYGQRRNDQNDWDNRFHSYDRRNNSRNSNYQQQNYNNQNNRGYNNYRMAPRYSNQDMRRKDSYNYNDNNFANRQQNPRVQNHQNNRPYRNGGGGNYPRPQHNQQRNHYDEFDSHNSCPDSNQHHNQNNYNQRRNFNREGNRDREGSYNKNQNYNQPQQSRNFSHRNNRYGSQNSLTSDSGTWERRNFKRNPRGRSQDSFRNDDVRSVPDRKDQMWEENDRSCEVAKNARNTSDFLKFLSEK